MDTRQSSPRIDGGLSAACLERAAELAGSGVLAHVDERGLGPGEQAMARGLPPGEYGEILGSGPTPEAVWRAWLASPTHRSILVEPGWTIWGWGSAARGSVTVYVLRFYKP